jgi:uncharacterized protein YndB with AHSA1/START domain
MKANNESATIAATKNIIIKRTFHLPLLQVWKAWTEPQFFKKWWGPKEFTCPYCSIHLHEGGTYLNAMRGPGGKDIWGTGTYKEIIPQQKIVYTDSFSDNRGNIVPATYYNMPPMPLELLVSVSFKEEDGETIMLLKHEGIPGEMQEDCEKGWQSSFDKLEAI